ncbi:MAG: DUF2800 domain-containing protein [Chloroflexi bacterium]|nr:DUF2800 domain-containing protein [Chloroflexota bacterium]
MTDITHLPLPEKFDRWRRRVLPHVHTGKEVGHTRVTTIAYTLEDRFAIEASAKRNLIVGLGLRPDLYTLAVSSTVEDRSTLKEIAEKAEDAAGANEGRILGSALHSFTDRIDAGEDFKVEAKWVDHIDAYCQTLADHFVTIHPEWMEKVCVLPDMTPPVAGKFDRLVTLSGDDKLTVADLKTGKDVTNYATSIAIQLALYANATHIWNGDGYDPMPEVNKDKALIIHLPAREHPPQCQLYLVDIAAGWEAARSRPGLLKCV